MGTDKRARQKEMHKTRLEQARKEAESLARRKRFVNASVVAVVIAAVVAGILFLTRDDSDSDTATGENTSQFGDTTAPSDDNADTTEADTPALEEGTAECPAADGSSERKESFDGPPKMCIDVARTYTAEVETTVGNFTMQFDAAKAPTTVNNFVFLARYHYFDGIIFHRIIKDFVIQGGDPEGTGTGGPGYQFADELPAEGEYKKYSLAMANSGPDTNGSQFFIITGPQGEALPPSYSVFGQVVDGFNVVDEIANVETADGDRPVEEVKMLKVTVNES